MNKSFKKLGLGCKYGDCPVNVLAATDRTKSHLDPSNKKDGIEMGLLAGLKFAESQSSPHNNKRGIALGLFCSPKQSHCYHTVELLPTIPLQSLQ